jgi:pimeloyl-[acyl-carrier protein] methyl ester esterase
MSLPLVFVHGWAFGPEFWAPLRRELGAREALTLDLGYFGPENLNLPDEPFVAVGHSLGLLWLLRHAPDRLAALVSLGGFGRFGVPAGPTRAMRRGLSRDPAQVIAAFHQACALPDDLTLDTTHIAEARPEQLAQGLDWLLQWDERPALEVFSRPLLALAAADDAIVPPDLSRASFPHGLIMLESGGHAFPASKSAQCARHIAPFLESACL